VLRADAQRQADQIRGEGDAERNRIFAEAYDKDPDFFAFYRSMQAYENGLKADNTRFILSPTSDFFRFFAAPGKEPAKSQAAPAAPAAGIPGLPGIAIPGLSPDQQAQLQAAGNQLLQGAQSMIPGLPNLFPGAAQPQAASGIAARSFGFHVKKILA